MFLEGRQGESIPLLQGGGSAQKKGSCWIHQFLRQPRVPENVLHVGWSGLTPVGREEQAWFLLISGSCGSSSTKPLTLYLQLLAGTGHRQTWIKIWAFFGQFPTFALQMYADYHYQHLHDRMKKEFLCSCSHRVTKLCPDPPVKIKVSSSGIPHATYPL